MHRLCFGFGFLLILFLNVVGPPSALAVFCGNTPSHNKFFGYRHPGDIELHMAHPVVDPLPDTVFTYDMEYPVRKDTHGNITYIKIEDQYTDGYGGCAWVFGGGVGFDFVTVHMESQKGHGIDFVIRIYGFKLLQQKQLE